MTYMKLKVIEKELPKFLTRQLGRPVSKIVDEIKRMSYVPGPMVKSADRVQDIDNKHIRIALYRPLGRLGQKSEDGEAVKQMGPPNQMQYLASSLLTAGYDVHIFDQLAEPYNEQRPLEYPSTKSDEQMVSEIIGWQPHVLMFGSFTCQFRRALKIAGEVKEKLGIPVVLGGYHVVDVGEQYRFALELEARYPDVATVLKEDLRNVFQRSIIDYVCVGEGITTVHEIMDILKAKKDPHAVEGIAFVDNGNIIITNRRNRLSIDVYPLLHWPPDYNPFMYYSQGRDYPVVLLTTSQGCRFSCSFCSVPKTYPDGLRYASTDRAILQLKAMKKALGGKWPRERIMVNLTDEDWMAKPRRVIDFCNAVYEAGLNEHFEFNSFGTLIDIEKRGDEMLKAMRKAGWSYFFFGVESTIDGAAQDWNRPDAKVHDRLAMIQRAINKTAAIGIMPFVDFIGGYPDHNLEQVTEDYSRLMTLRNVPYAYMPIIAPLPGTDLYWEVLLGAAERGFFDWVTYDHLDANNQVLPLRDGGEVKTLRNRMVQEFFTRKSYEEDADRMIEQHPHTARFFATTLRKESIDYPDNAELRRLARKYSEKL